MQRAGKCLILPLTSVVGIQGIHTSAIHVVVKPGDEKIRITVDAAASGLNAGTDMADILAKLGEFSNPNIRSMAKMLARAMRDGKRLLFKTDVSGAFSTMRLSMQAVLSQAVQFGDFVLLPLVSMFGWGGTPAYYNIVAKAIDWAHNGGVPRVVLNRWYIQQAEVISSVVHEEVVQRSMTYVDDTFGPCTLSTAAQDMHDVCVIIKQLLGPSAVNTKKTEGPLSALQIIGWRYDMITGMLQPSITGIKKMIWWLYRGIQINQEGIKITLKDLRQLVGLLRWYQAVIPFASTFALQALLTSKERKAAGVEKVMRKLVNIRLEAAR
jgi:hypothetical protein